MDNSKKINYEINGDHLPDRFVEKCRQCGGRVHMLAICHNDICPHCGQPCAPVCIKEVHILFDDNMKYWLTPYEHDLGYKIKIDYEALLFDYYFDVGDISDPPFSNSRIYSHAYCSAYQRKQILDQQLESLKHFDKTSVPIYLWFDPKRTDSYINLLYFSRFFREFDTVYKVPICYKLEDTAALSLAKKRKLQAKDFDRMTEEYIAVSSQGSYLRTVKNKVVCHFDEKTIEDVVLRVFSTEFLGFQKVECEIFERIWQELRFRITHRQVEDIVYRLCRSRKLKSRYHMSWGEDSIMMLSNEFRLAPDEYSFMTVFDLSDAIYDAIMYRETASLYNVLANKCVLFYEDSGKEDSVWGKDAIIRHIEEFFALFTQKENDISCCYGYESDSSSILLDDCDLIMTNETTASQYLINFSHHGNEITRISVHNWTLHNQ